MRAAIHDRPGGPDVLRCADVPDPVPAAGELLVRVAAISIEGGDLLVRRNVHPGSPPGVIGYAAAGEVVALGPAVEGFAVGQTVATFAFGGSHAELRAVPAATSWVVPPGLDVKAAAAVPCGAGTAALALRLGGVAAGQTVLVQGATGGVGVAAVQLAHRAGAHVLGSGSSADALRALLPLGLSDAIPADGRSVAEQVRRLSDGRGVDLLIDCVGGPSLTDALDAVAPGGRGVLVGTVGGFDQPISAAHLLMHRKTVIGCFLGPVMGEPMVHALVASMLREAAEGRLAVPIDAVFPLSRVAEGHARAERRGRIGRVILEP